MTQPPFPPTNFPDYGRVDAPRPGNGLAIASFVLGLLGCIPYLTGILAIIFGVVGIRNSRDRAGAGRGLAVAGLVLGILSILGWTGFGVGLGYGYLESKPAGAVAQQFLRDLTAGNVNAAAANSLLPAAQLQTQPAQLAPFGSFQSFQLTSYNISVYNGDLTMRLTGTATFTKTQKWCTFSLVKVSGTYKVTSFWLR